jgi:hypothetical protein
LGAVACGGSSSDAGQTDSQSSEPLTVDEWKEQAKPVLADLIDGSTDYLEAVIMAMELDSDDRESFVRSACDQLLDLVNRKEDFMLSAPDAGLVAQAQTTMAGYRAMAQDCKLTPLGEPVAGFDDALDALATTLDQQGLDLTTE